MRTREEKRKFRKRWRELAFSASPAVQQAVGLGVDRPTRKHMRERNLLVNLHRS